ncbi:MAG: epimerase [bacterium P3]|nr:MAG: epimerase [bacterium P3]KWW42036.1 MAG: epimerase [bacterium F083]
MQYYIVDAFTNQPFGGNPAGVVLLEGTHFPDEKTMQLIAAELRYSETVFVRNSGDRRFTLRYFTPCHEVALCGHATIAAFALLHSEGMADGSCCALTQAGELDVEAGAKVMMQMAQAGIDNPFPAEESAALYSAVGLDIQNTTLPVQSAYAGLKDIMLPITDKETLNNLNPDMRLIADLTKKHKAVSIHAFALSNDHHTAHVRNFAPLYGVTEESATGTANAALTYYLMHHNLLDGNSSCSFLQGEAMGRPSVIATRIDTDGSVYVGGTAYILSRGELKI